MLRLFLLALEFAYASRPKVLTREVDEDAGLAVWRRGEALGDTRRWVA